MWLPLAIKLATAFSILFPLFKIFAVLGYRTRKSSFLPSADTSSFLAAVWRRQTPAQVYYRSLWQTCENNCTPWQQMWSTKSADLIGHIKFLPWGQLNGCSVTRPFLSAKGVACETTAWDGDVNVWLRVSYNTLASLCVGGKEAIHLLNGIAIIQTW